MSAVKERPKSAYEISARPRPASYADADTVQRPRLPSYLQSTYTSHLRSSSQTSWDGLNLNRPRSISRPRPASPRPARRLERPHSIACLSDNYLLNVDRWSYDRVRMPFTPSSTEPPELQPSWRSSSPRTAPQSASPSSSPVSTRPISAHFVNAFGGPDDPTLPLPSTPYATGTGASTPTFSVTHPDGSTEPLPLVLPSPLHAQQQYNTLLPAAETEPPSPLKRDIHMTASRYEPSSSQSEISKGSETKNKTGRQRGMSVDSIMNTPGCCGLCERGTAKMIGGKITAWVVGTLIPVTFGVMTGVLSKIFH
ncbi:hypothetical protein QBC36DRAFT_358264 [Triangularia setosa]|uniref:Uncharacterized protein n=1 Tax=Triangularia setosa TaxID=2587417 RepID=A0AAN6W5S8_9PEZI|nr:hypothetical protein QBC36DRAFT_358264 [Podospora setosa]